MPGNIFPLYLRLSVQIAVFISSSPFSMSCQFHYEVLGQGDIPFVRFMSSEKNKTEEEEEEERHKCEHTVPHTSSHTSWQWRFEHHGVTASTECCKMLRVCILFSEFVNQEFLYIFLNDNESINYRGKTQRLRKYRCWWLNLPFLTCCSDRTVIGQRSLQALV